ncbi:hypothetical protein M758_UG237600 [Ceratodon purpureus]|nr:hypothetical protein M758_UG237600 [Ceratodon purpureus]
MKGILTLGSFASYASRRTSEFYTSKQQKVESVCRRGQIL